MTRLLQLTVFCQTIIHHDLVYANDDIATCNGASETSASGLAMLQRVSTRANKLTASARSERQGTSSDKKHALRMEQPMANSSKTVGNSSVSRSDSERIFPAEKNLSSARFWYQHPLETFDQFLTAFYTEAGQSHTNSTALAGSDLELALPSTGPKLNKLLLVLIEVLGFGFLGVDRCYMGQWCCGIIKGITGGGFVILFLIDYLNIVFNALLFKHDIDSFGMCAEWDDVWIAGCLAWIGLILNCCCGLGGTTALTTKAMQS